MRSFSIYLARVPIRVNELRFFLNWLKLTFSFSDLSFGADNDWSAIRRWIQFDAENGPYSWYDFYYRSFPIIQGFSI